MGTSPLIEERPDPGGLRRLEEVIYEFNLQATGISDGKLFASFLRDDDNAVIGGISGWTWGKTCFIGHLVVPAALRKQGYGTRLVEAVEAEAINRMRPNRSSNARLSSPAVLQQACLCSNRKDSRLSGRSPRNHDDKTFDQTEDADVISHRSLPWGKPVHPLSEYTVKDLGDSHLDRAYSVVIRAGLANLNRSISGVSA